MGSAGPYANHLHFTPDTVPHHSFFTGGVPLMIVRHGECNSLPSTTCSDDDDDDDGGGGALPATQPKASKHRRQLIQINFAVRCRWRMLRRWKAFWSMVVQSTLPTVCHGHGICLRTTSATRSNSCSSTFRPTKSPVPVRHSGLGPSAVRIQCSSTLTMWGMLCNNSYAPRAREIWDS